jgi:hypothetical protein
VAEMSSDNSVRKTSSCGDTTVRGKKVSTSTKNLINPKQRIKGNNSEEQSRSKSSNFDDKLATVVSEIDGVIEDALIANDGQADGKLLTVLQLAELSSSLEKLRLKSAKIICLQLDMGEASNFSKLISAFSEVMTDKYSAASLFSISVSTFYRWKSGETIPGEAFRRFAQRQIADFFLGDGTGIALFPASRHDCKSSATRAASTDLLSSGTRRLLN